MRTCRRFLFSGVPKFVALVVFLGSAMARANGDTIVVVPPVDGYYSYPYYYPDRITTFDDGVFNLSRPAPEFSRSGRYYGNEPAISIAERREWKHRCEPQLKKDFDSYRACFEKEKEKAEAASSRPHPH